MSNRETLVMSVETTPETLTRCPLCGGALNENATECTKCDWVQGYHGEEQVERNPRDIAALVLSVVPGAGHIFKGHTMGWLFMFLGAPVIVVMAFAFTMFFGWLLVPAYWIAVGVDAYLRKDLRANQPPPPVPPLTT